MASREKPAGASARKVRCPACGRPAVYSTENPSRPFCSMRCKNLDFGAWASEGYRVAAPLPMADEADDDVSGGD